MPRIDVRIKTDLAAKVVLLHNSKCIEKIARLKELSLSGGLLTGFEAAPKAQFSISLKLPSMVQAEFVGEMVKQCQCGSVVRFFFPDKLALAALWDYLRRTALDLIKQGVCPYCDKGLGAKADFCSACGQSLTFMNDDYLDKHLLATFSERIKVRLNMLDADFVERLIALMDSEILDMQRDACEEEFVGTAPGILQVFTMIRRAAATDMNVLILGESGTGKELTARAIHEKSLRKDKPFIVVNCAAIPDGLLEAELFGFERGAFTGAYLTKKGRFELADGGSIFLDEIGDLSPALQAKLLRFLEDHIIERVGGKSGTRVDIRIIAATNCDLEAMVANSHFRTDLFFRLNSFTIKLPPLRDRGDDKVILAKYFFKKFNKDGRKPLLGISEVALRAVRAYHWPGNVRELVNKVRRGLVMASGEFIEPADMELLPKTMPAGNCEIQHNDKRQRIFEVLEQNGFVVAHAAKALQISRPTMYSLIKKFEIDLPGLKNQPPHITSELR